MVVAIPHWESYVLFSDVSAAAQWFLSLSLMDFKQEERETWTEAVQHKWGFGEKF